MKPIRFFKFEDKKYGKITFSVVIDKNAFSKSTQNTIMYCVIGFCFLCVFLCPIAIWSCIDKGSIDFGQFIFILVTGAVGYFFLRIPFGKKFDQFFAEVAEIFKEIFTNIKNKFANLFAEFKNICLDIYAKTSCIYDKK